MKTTPKKSKKIKRLIKSESARLKGDLQRWGTRVNRLVVCSPGVRHLAERAEAYWLIDAIASYLLPSVLEPAGEKDPRILSLHFWRLKVAEDRSAVLQADADFGLVPFVRQEIPYTDFPLRDIAIWAGFDGCRWVLYLPSEH